MRSIFYSVVFLILLALVAVAPNNIVDRHAKYFHVAAVSEGDKTVWQFTGPAYQVCVQTSRLNWECHR